MFMLNFEINRPLMPSIVPGFEYDIFISYRQKDNKHDGWVTEFVNQLKGELEATFKEDISIYFDENPHDGLLETHSVDKSLEAKLKCLIFIPIISQTYCDSKSFAWQHEFCAFNKLVKEDPFGRDIKLTSGNVASRILPVKIHDLDAEDKTLLENELGGILRSIEFIYKAPGVNRPLRANEDHPQDNLNKTYYRDQINKVANAVKEIIAALKKQRQHPEEVLKQNLELKSAPHRDLKTKIIAGALIFLALIVAGYFIIPKLFKSSGPVEKSIAVLPFTNRSNDPEQEYFCDGMVDEIIDRLFKIGDLKVIARTLSMRYKNTKRTLKEIARELGASALLEGSVQKIGNKVRITAQLIDPRTGFQKWSEKYDRDFSDVFSIQSEIAQTVAAELKAVITPQEKLLIEKRPTENLEAYPFYLKGNEFYWQSNNQVALQKAIEMYEKAIKSDPNFALAYAKLSICHSRIYFYSHAKERLIKSKSAIDSVLKISPNLPEAHLALGANYYNAAIDYTKARDEISTAEKQLPNNSECAYWEGLICRRSGFWEQGKQSLIRASKLDPGSAVIANATGQILSRMRDYPASEYYFKKAIYNNPSYHEPYYECSLVYLKWKGDTVKAREILDEAFKSVGPEGKIYIIYYKTLLEILNGNYQIALTYLPDLDKNTTNIAYFNSLISLLYATTYKLLNQPEKAVSYFNSAKKLLESYINQNPDNTGLYMSYLGVAYAGLGMKSEAIATGKKGVELFPISKDASTGPRCIENLAKIYVMTGEYNLALEQIKYSLSINAGLTVNMLLLDPDWKPLWDLPEFKKIVK
jgi:TolB-like protein/Tfp pilus assembly protein PilF